MSITLTATPDLRAGAILVIDDEMQIRRALSEALAPLCDEVVEAATGAAGIAQAAAASPDLIILDLGLPDMAGVSVCLEIRRWSTVPIVVLSARHAEQEKVELFSAGADDYVTKPFGLAELVARVQAQLRRARVAMHSSTTPFLYDGLSIDIAHREVRRDGTLIRLTRTEWQLLQTFVTHAGRTLTHQQIFDLVWAKSFGNPQQYLRVHLTNLRRKIEREPAAPRLIITEPGVGYRFVVPQE
ncbi:MAG: response regulator transcription factor [Polaromonas sp.]|nr:response regulator transcription factor [Gemmatimonadaceae bacterium]